MFWIDQRNRVNAFSSRLVNIEWHFELKCLADGEVQLTGDAGNKFERSQDANGTESAQIHVQIFLDDHRHKSAKSHHIHNPTLAHYIHISTHINIEVYIYIYQWRRDPPAFANRRSFRFNQLLSSLVLDIVRYGFICYCRLANAGSDGLVNGAFT